MNLFCKSGKHPWTDPNRRCRCCNGYIRVQDTSRKGLEEIGAEHIVLAGMWRGWLKVEKKKCL